MFQHTAARRRLVRCLAFLNEKKRFNTQPPEGGWFFAFSICFILDMFQHTAARRRLGPAYDTNWFAVWFQHTAARRRLAWMREATVNLWPFQHTAARRRLAIYFCGYKSSAKFQHTAARRRLAKTFDMGILGTFVSTHSRPKAAGTTQATTTCAKGCFNTQPPEGGWG